MPRLPNLTERSEVPEDVQEAYERVAALRQGTVSGPYGILLHSPELAERAAFLGNLVRWHSTLTPAQREVAILAAARQFEADVMWAGHARLARDAGIPGEVIEAIGRRADPADLESDASDIVAFVRALLETNRVPSEVFDAVRDRLGDRGIVDLTGLIGYYAFVGAILNAFEVEPAASAAAPPWRIGD